MHPPDRASTSSYVTDLIEKLERHLQLKMMARHSTSETRPPSSSIVDQIGGGGDLTLARVAEQHRSHERRRSPSTRSGCSRVTQLIKQLKALKLEVRPRASTGRRVGRSMGMINATGCTSVWGSTWPYNPYPFPWANHLFQDTAVHWPWVCSRGTWPSMAEGFKAIRMAELELSEEATIPAKHDERFSATSTGRTSPTRSGSCVRRSSAVGGDGAMYDIGFQNLSAADDASGKPVKVLVVDTQVYSNTGGQACTSASWGRSPIWRSSARRTAGRKRCARRSA